MMEKECILVGKTLVCAAIKNNGYTYDDDAAWRRAASLGEN